MIGIVFLDFDWIISLDNLPPTALLIKLADARILSAANLLLAVLVTFDR